jgi:ribosome-associated protein
VSRIFLQPIQGVALTDQNIPTTTIRDNYIELYKILKRENMAASGGEAKFLISEGMVLVNGEVETRKRRKTVAGDVVECHGEKVMVVGTSTCVSCQGRTTDQLCRSNKP